MAAAYLYTSRADNLILQLRVSYRTLPPNNGLKAELLRGGETPLHFVPLIPLPPRCGKPLLRGPIISLMNSTTIPTSVIVDFSFVQVNNLSRLCMLTQCSAFLPGDKSGKNFEAMERGLSRMDEPASRLSR